MPPAPYPLVVTETRTASRQALVSYRGNRYSVPPELAGAQVHIGRALDCEFIDVSTASGIVIARHRLAGDGTGAVVRDHGHVHALEQAAMAAANTGRPHRRKERIPPGLDAVIAAEALRRSATGDTSANPDNPESATNAADSAVTDLAAYERAARGRNTLS